MNVAEMDATNHGSKPIIGLLGGIGGGKSTIGRMFAAQGCMIIDADALAHDILQSDDVKHEIRAWLGDAVFEADGSVNRKAVARHVFSGPAEIARLNALIHPRVGAERKKRTAEGMADPRIVAVVWDIPLLLEIGLDRECDAVVFVNVPREERLRRLKASRGWGEQEVTRREKLQIPLDKKQQVADYCVDNSGDEATSLRQVQQVLSQILQAYR